MKFLFVIGRRMSEQQSRDVGWTTDLNNLLFILSSKVFNFVVVRDVWRWHMTSTRSEDDRLPLIGALSQLQNLHNFSVVGGRAVCDFFFRRTLDGKKKIKTERQRWTE